MMVRSFSCGGNYTAKKPTRFSAKFTSCKILAAVSKMARRKLQDSQDIYKYKRSV
jgi:hypothetical protein